jgi:protocadherin Fat 1/2/3
MIQVQCNGLKTVLHVAGVIMVSEALDREEMSRHMLTIMVRDQGIPSKKSFARVEIYIEDDNDHTPRFLSKVFEGRVFETAAIGCSVVQVMAMDEDKGSNSELSYAILSGMGYVPVCVLYLCVCVCVIAVCL